MEGMDRFIILIMVLLIVPWVDEYIKSPQDTVYCLTIIPQYDCLKKESTVINQLYFNEKEGKLKSPC